jgi:hypothetical protein
LQINSEAFPIYFEDKGTPTILENENTSLTLHQAGLFYSRAMNAVAAGENQEDGKMVDHYDEIFLCLDRSFVSNRPCICVWLADAEHAPKRSIGD